MASIVPRPIFADAASILLKQDAYDSRFPSIAKYLSEFSPGLNVAEDFRWARRFLIMHNRAPGTYGNYRGSVERLLLWSWIERKKSVLTLNRKDFLEFMTFNQSPPPLWAANGIKRRFLETVEGVTFFNEDWKPFDAAALKWAAGGGCPEGASYDPSYRSLRQVLSICSSFYYYLHGEGAVGVNPVVATRPQGFRGRTKTDAPVVNFLNPNQWSYVIRAAEKMAKERKSNERALFIIAATYFMFLGGSDLSSDEGANHTMGEFVLRGDQWWLELEHPRKPTKPIAVNPDFLPYLSRYRKSKRLTPLPLPGEKTVLLRTIYGRPGLTSRHIRDLVAPVFNRAYLDMRGAGELETECAALLHVSMRTIQATGVKEASRTLSPHELQRQLGGSSVAYVYSRFYRDD